MNNIKDMTPNDVNSEFTNDGLIVRKIGFVEISYGTVNNDFCIHFTTWHPSRLLPTDETITRQTIVTFLHESIPDNLEVEYHPSPTTWDKKLISVIVKNVGWNFDETKVVESIQVVGEKLTEIINKNSIQREF